MPGLKHFYGQNRLDYLTANTYRKARIFDSDRCKRKLVGTLDDLRAELGFRIIRYVLVAERLADSSVPAMGRPPRKRGMIAAMRWSGAQT